MKDPGLIEVRAFVSCAVRDQIEKHREHEEKMAGCKVAFSETAGRLLAKSLRVVFAP
jgi:hypothetical protein